jgi:hypothetical protein
VHVLEPAIFTRRVRGCRFAPDAMPKSAASASVERDDLRAPPSSSSDFRLLAMSRAKAAESLALVDI